MASRVSFEDLNSRVAEYLRRNLAGQIYLPSNSDDKPKPSSAIQLPTTSEELGELQRKYTVELAASGYYDRSLQDRFQVLFQASTDKDFRKDFMSQNTSLINVLRRGGLCLILVSPATSLYSYLSSEYGVTLLHGRIRDSRHACRRYQVTIAPYLCKIIHEPSYKLPTLSKYFDQANVRNLRLQKSRKLRSLR
ncbi:uncharacterized protein RSE6_12300 [Rhynchosporium secalis]|uniref:Uncharacterized protein n=1 Tax=Rhynchosporium secalis TaxID=38038 RepID=A0A1E1MQ04_RHYSE|nr:uncharacterized protein RSE6_12300 [Rhynchosporium secalis]